MLESEVMWKAAEHVDAGWCQNRLEDAQGNVCAVGAIHKASRDIDQVKLSHSQSFSCRQALCETLIEQGLLPVGSFSGIARWNNAAGRTAQEVAEMMRKTAIKLEEQGR